MDDSDVPNVATLIVFFGFPPSPGNVHPKSMLTESMSIRNKFILFLSISVLPLSKPFPFAPEYPLELQSAQAFQVNSQ